MSSPNEILARVNEVARKNPENIACNVFDPAYYATLDGQDQTGLLRCIKSGVENPGSGMGCYAYHPDDYDRYKPFFSQVLAAYHCVPEDAVHTNNVGRRVLTPPCVISCPPRNKPTNNNKHGPPKEAACNVAWRQDAHPQFDISHEVAEACVLIAPVLCLTRVVLRLSDPPWQQPR